MPESSTSTVRRSVSVPASIAQAFAVFTEQIRDWWPSEYSWSETGLESISIDPKRGVWFETDRTGAEIVWGRVLAWDPPRRIVLGWQIAPDRTIETDPERASEIEIRFASEGPSTTRLDLVHRHFERQGPGGQAMRAGMASPEGWTKILSRYSLAVAA